MKPSSEGRFRRKGRNNPEVKTTAALVRSGSRYKDKQARDERIALAKKLEEQKKAQLAAQEEAEEAAEEAAVETVQETAAENAEAAVETTEEAVEDAAEEAAEETAVQEEVSEDECLDDEEVAEDEYFDEEETAEDEYLDDEEEPEGGYLDDEDEDEAEDAEEAEKVDAEEAEELDAEEAEAEDADDAAVEEAEAAQEESAEVEEAQAEDQTAEVEEAQPSGSRYADKQIENKPAAAAQAEKEKLTFAGWWASYTQNLKAKKPGAIVGTCAAAAVAAAYVGGAVYFDRHFYPKTEIFGITCGGANEQELTDAVKAKVGEYTLTVSGRDGLKDTIDASSIGLEYTEDGGIRKALKNQQSFIWPFRLLGDTRSQAEVGTGYDKEMAEQTIRSLSIMQHENQVEPVDAHMGETDTAYEVVPEVEGSTLRTGDAVNAILEALTDGADQIDLDEKKCYIEPAVRSDDKALNEKVDALNAVLGADITYSFGDTKERVNTKDFLEQREDGSYYFSEEKIWNYVAELADKYDTFGRVKTFYTSIGTTVELYGGDYGWAMNQADTAQILLEDCIAKKVETIEPIYDYVAKSHGENDIGGTYVEICISRQEMWCYQDGYLMVDTPVVTGNPNKNNATPSGGVWAIDAKMTDYTLVGEGYRAPVNYWMPFNGNVGIHDLTSRGAFGGTIYLYGGSHGCVNTPLDAVRQIYNIVSIGTPVIVYD